MTTGFSELDKKFKNFQKKNTCNVLQVFDKIFYCLQSYFCTNYLKK